MMSEVVYGRTVLKKKPISEALKKRILLSWGIFTVSGLFVGSLLTGLLISKPAEVVTVKETIVREVPMKSDFVKLPVPMNVEMQKFAYALATEYRVDFPLVMAVINQESRFKIEAKSDTGDHGLMQINEINHKWLQQDLGVQDFTNAHQNIFAGVYMLHKLFVKYDDPRKVLMAYNMGETGAATWWKRGIYTSNYAESVLLKADEYRRHTERVLKDGKN